MNLTHITGSISISSSSNINSNSRSNVQIASHNFIVTNSNQPSKAAYVYKELTGKSAKNQIYRSVMYTRDWRSALRTPPTYRIGNRAVRFNYHFALIVFCACTLFILLCYVRTGSKSSSDTAWLRNVASIDATTKSNMLTSVYNATYPLTPPVIMHTGIVSYRIAVVADLDTNSKLIKDDGNTVWRSYLKKGHLSYTAATNEIHIKWDDALPIALETSFALKDRGMELSELVTFNGKLLTFDDRTGLIYEIINDKPIPWVILLDGNGKSTKGFKSEWATVKQQELYVGSMGKEWTTSMGDFENENPMYVKVVSPMGVVRSHNWSDHFKLMRLEARQITWPGYMIHESGVWSDVHKSWYFLPRRCSKEKYNETRDEHMGCNVLIQADENFHRIHTVTLDAANTAATATHGFSSFKFLPGTDDRIIVAIKSEELNGKTSTFIMAFNVDGKMFLPEQSISTEYKYEGFEFI